LAPPFELNHTAPRRRVQRPPIPQRPPREIVRGGRKEAVCASVPSITSIWCLSVQRVGDRRVPSGKQPPHAWMADWVDGRANRGLDDVACESGESSICYAKDLDARMMDGLSEAGEAVASW